MACSRTPVTEGTPTQPKGSKCLLPDTLARYLPLATSSRDLKLIRFPLPLIALCVCLATPAMAREIRGTAHVRDADTVVVGGVPVRLNGIDAPEMSNRYGRDAAAFLRRLVRGATLVCDLNGERTHDRWVGVCFMSIDGQMVDVGAVVVANGHALDCRRYSGGRYRPLEPAGARSRLRQAGYC